jgi:hypothetical protein
VIALGLSEPFTYSMALLLTCKGGATLSLPTGSSVSPTSCWPGTVGFTNPYGHHVSDIITDVAVCMVAP